MIDDTEIINAVRRDSENGFRILMKEKWESVYWHIRRLLVSHADAQDATQETFIRIFRSFSSFKGDSSLKVWIYRIATNEALRLYGKRRNDKVSMDDNGIPEVRMIAEEEYVNYADVEAVKLQEAILHLPAKQRLTFNMRYYDAPEGTEIHTIQPIGKDRVLFVQNGKPAKVVVMKIPSCQTEYEFEVPASEKVHGQFRNARLTTRGTLLQAHMGPGVTLTAKNWYGATDISLLWRHNAHNGFSQDKRNGKPGYKTFIDWMAHKDMGKKALLYLIDGTYASRHVNGKPFQKWQKPPFNNDWCCSIIVSQDEVACDAVAMDLIISEWPEFQSLNYCDEYLLEAASLPNAPSGTTYKQDGKPLEKPLGLMEHCDKEREYKKLELIYKKL